MFIDKSTYMIIKSISCCILFSMVFSSCNKDDDKLSLPEITSSGNNTFGCYVENDLFVYTPGSGILGKPPIEANYDDDSNALSIISYAKDNLFIGITDSIVEVGKTYEISYAVFQDYNTWYYLCEDVYNEIHLLKFDIENKIVSGTFSFSVKNPENGEIKAITKGQFDVKMTILNND